MNCPVTVKAALPVIVADPDIVRLPLMVVTEVIVFAPPLLKVRL